MNNNNMAEFYADLVWMSQVTTQADTASQASQQMQKTDQVVSQTAPDQTLTTTSNIQNQQVSSDISQNKSGWEISDEELDKLIAELEKATWSSSIDPDVKVDDKTDKKVDEIKNQKSIDNNENISIQDISSNEEYIKLLEKNRNLEKMIDDLTKDSQDEISRAESKNAKKYELELEALRNENEIYKKQSRDFFEKYQASIYDEKRVNVPEEFSVLVRLKQEYTNTTDERFKKILKDKYDAELIQLAEKNFGRALDPYIRDTMAFGSMNVPDTLSQYKIPNATTNNKKDELMSSMFDRF